MPLFVDNEVITLTKDGLWLSNGTEIEHETTLKLFPKILKKDSEGYFLELQKEIKRVVVEDTAYFVVSIEGSSIRGYSVLLNDESRESLDPKNLSYKPGRLACKIKNGTEEAKFLHAPYFELLKELEEDDDGYFLRISNIRVNLSRA